MMRWLVSLVSLLATLVAGGCQIAQSTVSNAVDPAKLVPQKPAVDRTPPDKLPDLAGPRTADTVADKRWDKFTIAPPPPQAPNALEPIKPADIVPTVALTPPKHPIVAALECMLENRPQEAQYHLRGYDARTQDIILRALPPLSIIAKNQPTPADVAAIADSLNQLRIKFLEQYADFTLPKMCYCEWIKGYEIYKPLPPDHGFVASLPERPGELVQLYIELRNFGSQPNQDLFETKLLGQIEIRDQNDRLRWSHHFRPDDLKLVSRTRLGEYYHNFTFTLPASLPPGAYSLVVQMTDDTQAGAPRTARGNLPLRIVAAKE